MLNKDFILNEWIPALRSGEFQQTQFGLRKKIDGKFAYCCLGVACELLRRKDVLVGNWEHYGNDRDGFRIADTNVVLSAWLPNEAQQFIGFYSSKGPVLSMTNENGEELLDNLGHINDNGFTFVQIADALEAYVEVYDE